ncbi:MAG: hypothetical protein Q9M97_07045 [Candidatus Gracilibacteria bacterium]|nr:hypothetical protein [Candidatus Gracilibacteria bacterium]
MNKIVSQIILGFIFITFLVILSFYTFFAGEKKELNSPDFNISKIGNQELDGLISDKINFSTTIYSINKDYKISDNIISFGTGIYLIDSRDIFSTVTLEMGTNKVLLKGGGMVYVNNDSKYKIISSFNNKIKIEFLNTITNKKGVEVYLYPHMYLGFRPTRFNKKEEADSLRVSQLGSLKYFNGNLLDISKGGKINFAQNRK